VIDGIDVAAANNNVVKFLPLHVTDSYYVLVEKGESQLAGLTYTNSALTINRVTGNFFWMAGGPKGWTESTGHCSPPSASAKL
jgi:hypothetical protein